MYILRPDTLPFGRHNLFHMGDLHIGNAQTDEKLIQKDLEYAAENNAHIGLNGDIFDAIISADTKRYRPGAVHRSIRGRTDLLNAALDRGEKLLRPFAESIYMLGDGNHETYIERVASLDLGLLLADKLGVPYGGYTGFIDFRFADEHRHTQRLVEFYHHGSGGGASAGSVANDLLATGGFIDADIIWLAHRHTKLATHYCRLKCPLGGNKPMYRDTRFITNGAYMKVWTHQGKRPRKQSYAEDKKLRPQGTGGVMVTLDVSVAGIDIKVTT